MLEISLVKFFLYFDFCLSMYLFLTNRDFFRPFLLVLIVLFLYLSFVYRFNLWIQVDIVINVILH